jgi:hypothetical protein
MLSEQLLGFAIKTLTRAYETKERIKSNLTSENLSNYVRSMKDTAMGLVEHQWQKLRQRSLNVNFANRVKSFSSSPQHHPREMAKRPRKSSIKPAKEIWSSRADIVLAMLRDNHARLVDKSDTINGKTSLAYLVWALGHAERANIAEGISVHDVSALLYRACNIELYPINISRVVYGNHALVKQAGQQKRTKTYLLTADGATLFKKHFT